MKQMWWTFLGASQSSVALRRLLHQILGRGAVIVPAIGAVGVDHGASERVVDAARVRLLVMAHSNTNETFPPLV